MSWSVSTGPTDRDQLWNAIDLLTAEQEGADPEELGFQLVHAKAAAKALCNSFDCVEYPQLVVTLSGHAYVEGQAAPSISASVYSPAIPVSAQNAPAANVSEEEQAEEQAEEAAAETQQPEANATEPTGGTE